MASDSNSLTGSTAGARLSVPTARPRVSVVIRCCNEEQHIGRLLSGIMQQSIKDVEIIVVDSGSTDATLPIVSRYPVKIVSIRPEDFSFGRSLNLGCAAATADFIAIASAHVYPVYRDWLEQLLKPFADPKTVLTYGKQRGNEITKYSEHQIFAKWFPDTSARVQDHPFCNNANACIRRSAWEQMHYDEEITGLEDLDWAKRVTETGMRLSYNAEAEIIHVHDETPRRIFNRYRREAIAFKKIFPKEHFRFTDLIGMLLTNMMSDYFHALHDRVFWRNLFSIPVFRTMQFLGTHKGFAQHGPLSGRLKQTFYYPRSLSRNEAGTSEERSKQLIDYNRSDRDQGLAKV